MMMMMNSYPTFPIQKEMAKVAYIIIIIIIISQTFP